MGSNNYSTPVVVNGKIIFGSGDNNIYALDQKTGKKIWSFNANSSVFASPLVVNNTVYINSTSGNLYALNFSDGSLKWSFKTLFDLYGKATFANGFVYIVSDKVYCINATTGVLKWSQEISSTGCVSVKNETIYVTDFEGNLNALNESNGELKWKFKNPLNNFFNINYSSPIVANNQIYYTVYNYVIAVNLNGTLKWKYILEKYDDITRGEMLYMDGKIYLGGYLGYYYCLKADTGEKVWISENTSNYNVSPIGIDKNGKTVHMRWYTKSLQFFA